MTAALIAMLLSAGPGPLELRLDRTVEPTVSFTLHHALHDVQGRTHAVEGKALSFQDGTIEVEVRVALPSFGTGSPAIDEDFLELLDAARYPDVTVRAIVPPEAVPQPGGEAVDAESKVQINLHGKTRNFPAAAKIARSAGGRLKASGHFVVELHDFDIETPRYMFIGASPTILIAFDLSWLTEQIASTALLAGFESIAEDGGVGSVGAGTTPAVLDAGSAPAAASDAGSTAPPDGGTSGGSSGGTTGGTASDGGGSASGGTGGIGVDGGP